jgi:hypothetical protein
MRRRLLATIVGAVAGALLLAGLGTLVLAGIGTRRYAESRTTSPSSATPRSDRGCW